MKNTFLFFFLLFAGNANSQTINLTEFSSGYNWLIGTTNAGDGRLFAIQKTGQIFFSDSEGNRNPTPFMDISARVRASASDERGLLGVAFHPEYESNGFFYVFYNRAVSGNITISRFERDANNENLANPDSEVELISFAHPRSNHIGGALVFGPDGYLYAGIGDGGGSGDPDRAGQDLSVLSGKILRFDISNGTAGIPADNPFVNTPGARPEIWAYGLRNPWRITFDRWTGDLWIADVGQNELEEIDLQLADSEGGENYGWSCREGSEIFNNSECMPGVDLQDPIFEYGHVGGNCGGSISGGVAYRGMEYGDLFGNYFAADFCTGDIYMVDKAGNGRSLGTFSEFEYTTLSENSFGEMFLSGFFTNSVFKIESADARPTAFITNGTNLSICEGDSLRLGAYNIQGANFSYRWLFNGTPISGVTGPEVTVAEDGDYQVIVRNESTGMENTSPVTTLQQTAILRETINETVDVGTVFQGILINGDTSFMQTFQSSFGCDSIVTYYINGFSSAAEVEKLIGNFEIAPNPIFDNLSIKIDLSTAADIKIDLYDFKGNFVENILNNQRVVDGRHVFNKDLNAIPTGFYYVVATTNKGILTRKLLKI